MAAAAQLLSSLDHNFEGLSPELKRAARWVKDNPRDVGLRSMRECARRAQVAPATMTRLAQALGLDGFEALREPLRAALAAGDDFAARAQALQRERAASDDWLAHLLAEQRANLEAIAPTHARTELEAVASAMLRAPRVWFLGLRVCHGIAFDLHYRHQLLAANGVLLTGVAGTLSDQVDQIGGSDVLVAISMAPYTRETVLAAQEAVSRGVRVVALTDSALSPLARGAWKVLTFRTGSSSFFHSLVGALALCEALGAATAAIGGAHVVRRLEARRQRLHAQGAYWEKRRAARTTTSKGARASRRSR
ncbi:MAG TPA: MurR/RpiR family transcriptional regulator [Casimicrobiaceae bacterium]|nr:MurR/RpiR family transcriptional regulator [Casimicrobiaceae bacterium]